MSKNTIPALDFNILRKSDDEILLAYRNANNTNGLKKLKTDGSLENSAYQVNFNSMGILNAVVFDDVGNYYLASDNGLYSSKDNFKYTTASGLASNVINDVVIDQTGILWIATDNGLNYLKNGLFSTLGLGEKCSKLLVDDNNVVWVIKKGNLFYVENDLFMNTTSLLLDPVLDIELDENGEIWTNMGLNLAKKGISNEFIGQSNNRFIGRDIDYLTNQRFISTYESNVIFNYGNHSQRNINFIGSSKLKTVAYRSGNFVEAWIIGKGSLAKIIGWELSLDPQQLDGLELHGIVPTMIQMPNKDYALSKTEVTMEQYKLCVDLGACSLPGTSGSCNWGIIGREKHPINCVDKYQSRNYSQWIGGDLPTLEQWYYAATGGGQNIVYPWGNVFPTCQLANFNYCVGGTVPVCSTVSGNTTQGLCDMGGNVYEWNLEVIDSLGLCRGGGYESTSEPLRSAIQTQIQLGARIFLLGFRVAISIH